MIIDCDDCKLLLYKSSSTEQCIVGETVTYTIELINKFCGPLENIIVKDLLPPDLKFVKGSVKINFKKCEETNIISGVYIDIIGIGETALITFDAEVVSKSSHKILNQATAEYKYRECGVEYYQYCESTTNKLLVKNPSIIISKKANKKSVYLGDKIKYTIVITNNGDLDAFNVCLIDKVPSSLKVIEGTFYIDDILVNSVEVEKGVILDCIVTGETKTITYIAEVVSGGCGGKIENKAVVKYAYRLPNGYISCKESNIASVVVNMHISSFKQINIDEYLWIPPQKPNIEEINDIKALVKIDKYNIIKTSKAKSSEGQILSGYKLVVHGHITQVIEYTACEPTQTVHSAHYKAPFSTFIILPPDFKIGSKVELEGIVEDVYYSVIDDRCFFKNLTILIMAKINSY